jgi:alpha-beta hydrolase superfamily lysophospholipase/SAM-dependent methyltransferase
MTSHEFISWDGTALFYRAWLPDRPTDKALLLFHRGHEHSGRWEELVAALDLGDVAVFAWDARGHGRSPGERGSAENLAVVVKDVDEFVRHIAGHHAIPMRNMVVLAHSVGAVTVTAWVHDYAPPIRGLVLATPAFRVRLYVPFAVPLLRLKQRLFGRGFVKSYVKARMLTHDPDQTAAYQEDKLIFRQIADHILLDLHDTSTRLLADAGAIHTPTLLLGAGADWVVDLAAQCEFFNRLSSTVKEMEVFPGMYHAIFHEKEREAVVRRVRRFVLARFDQPPAEPSLAEADRCGYTKAEFDRLNAPGGISFKLVKFGMKTIGRLSEGIRLGWRAGFDSGATLDYVYENKPRGTTPLGRWIDRAYLSSIGWRGIRERRKCLEKLLRRAIEQTHAGGRPVRILDIAAGAGRYVLDTLRALAAIPMTALLRDYKPENLEAARRLADTLGLRNVTVAQGDAFDRASLAAVTPRPTVAIVSGLYELFPANAPLVESLRGLAEAIEPGGFLIYTNQPWHPQVEFIARVLVNREGRPWIMRRRTQAEMDELVRAAGFEKLAMEIDPWGIFTVSLARRVGA